MSQANWTIIILLALAALIVLATIVARKFRLEPKCQFCESKDIVEIDRQTLASRTVETIGSGTPAGGNIRLQLDLELTYRCHNCGQKFKRRFTQTQ